MGWFLTALLFVGAFVLSILLRPKQRTDVTPIEPPTSEDGKVIPRVFGTCKVAPNVTWFGDVKTKAIKKDADPLGLTKTTIGHRYFAGMQLVLAWGEIDELVDILFEDKRSLDATGTQHIIEDVFPPSINSRDAVVPGLPLLSDAGSVVNGHVQLDIAAPKLFGGTKEGAGQGGVSGLMDFYFGTTTQTENDYLGDKVLAPATEDMPAYKRLSYAVLRQMYLGNSPYLKPIHFVLRRSSNPIALNPIHVAQHGDCNPAAAIHDLLTDENPGTSADLVPDVDYKVNHLTDDSLFTLGGICGNEELSVSFLQDGSKTALELIDEILRHVDGVRYEDPETGQLIFKLIRPADPVVLAVTPENARDMTYSRPSWREVSTEVRVRYTKKDEHFRTATVQAQNLAAFQAVGEVRSETIDFPMFTHEEVAQMAAYRVARVKTTPLGKCSFTMDRKGSALSPGDKFSVTWPDYALNAVTFRVNRIGYGDREDGRITVDAVQDVFDATDPIWAEPPPAEWTDPADPNGPIQPPDVITRKSQTATTGTLELYLVDPDSRVTLVEFSTKVGQAAQSSYSADTEPYAASVALDPKHPSRIYWRVTWTLPDGTDDTIEGWEDFSISAKPRAPSIELTLNTSNGQVSAKVRANDADAVTAKLAVSTTQYPFEATVRAQAAQTLASGVFDYGVVATLGEGRRLYAAAFTYSATPASIESDLGTNTVAHSSAALALPDGSRGSMLWHNGVGWVTLPPPLNPLSKVHLIYSHTHQQPLWAPDCCGQDPPDDCTPSEEGEESPVADLVAGLLAEGATRVPFVYSSKAWLLTRDVSGADKIMAWQDARCTKATGWMAFRAATNASGHGCIKAGYAAGLDGVSAFTIMGEAVHYENANSTFFFFGHNNSSNLNGISVFPSGTNLTFHIRQGGVLSAFQDGPFADAGIVPGTRYRWAATYDSAAVGSGNKLRTWASVYDIAAGTYGAWTELGAGAGSGEGTVPATIDTDTNRRVTLGGVQDGTLGAFFGLLKDVRVISGTALDAAGLASEITTPAADHRWLLDDGAAADTGATGGLDGTIGPWVVSVSDEEGGGHPLVSKATTDGNETNAPSKGEDCTVSTGVLYAAGGQIVRATGGSVGMSYIGALPSVSGEQEETILDLQENAPNFALSRILSLGRDDPDGLTARTQAVGPANYATTVSTATRRIAHVRRTQSGGSVTIGVRLSDGTEATATGTQAAVTPRHLTVGATRDTTQNADINPRVIVGVEGDYTTALQDLVTAWAQGQHGAVSEDTAVASVELSPSSATMTVGATQPFTAIPRNSAGLQIPGKTAAWNSTVPADATVSQTGPTTATVTAVSDGATVIEAEIDGITGSAAVTVNASPPPPGDPGDFDEPADFIPDVDSAMASDDVGWATRGSAPVFVNNQSDDPISPNSAAEMRYPAGGSSNEVPGIGVLSKAVTPARARYLAFVIKIKGPYMSGVDGDEKIAYAKAGDKPHSYIQITGPGTGETSSNFGIVLNYGAQDGSQPFVSLDTPVSLEVDAYHIIEATFVASSSPGANDGQLHCRVNGADKLTKTGVDVASDLYNEIGMYPQFGNDAPPNRTVDHVVWYAHVRSSYKH